MKKPILAVLIAITAVGTTGCLGLFDQYEKYCIVDGCPSETFYSNYCYYHRCSNNDCTNQEYQDGYCKTCLKRAGYNID